MKIIDIKCPKCGGELHIGEGRKDCFCEYCGSHLFFEDDECDRTITNITIIRDEAKIKDAEARMKREEVLDKGLDIIKNHRDFRETIKAIEIFAVILFVFTSRAFSGPLTIIRDLLFAIVVGLGIYLYFTRDKSSNEDTDSKKKKRR